MQLRSQIASTVLFSCVLAIAVTPALAVPIQWQSGVGGNGHYYERVFNPGGITWTDAKTGAESTSFLGTAGHLATVNSEAEWQFIIGNLGTNYTWIGLSDSAQEGNFQWVTGEPLTFTAWLTSPQEPNNAAPPPGEDHVYYETRSGVHGWNDYRNTVAVSGGPPFGYLVEYAVPEPSSIVLALIGALAAIALRRRVRESTLARLAILAGAILVCGMTTAHASDYADLILSDNPIAYWRLGDQGTTNAADASPQSLDGTHTKGVLLGQPGAVVGDGDTSAHFDGVDDYVHVAETPLLNQLQNGFTIEAWVWLTPDSNGWVASTRDHGTNGGYGFAVRPELMAFTAFSIKGYELAISVPVEEWVHAAVVFDTGNDATFYLNGDPVGSIAGNFPAHDNSQEFNIGRNPVLGTAGTHGNFKGRIDEVAVYGRELDPGEINEHYLVAVPEPSSIALLSMALVTFLYTAKPTKGAKLATRLGIGLCRAAGEFVCATWRGGQERSLQVVSKRATLRLLNRAGASLMLVLPALGPSTTLASSYESTVLADGPVGYWRLGEASGPNAFDASGNAYHGTYQGGVALGIAGALATDSDTAAEFDGSSGLVDVGAVSALNQLANAFTVEAWVKLPGTGSGGVIVSTRKVIPNTGYGFAVLPDLMRFAAFGQQDYSLTVALPLNEWLHVAVDFDSANDARFYVNGQLEGLVAGTAPASTTTQPFTIGRNTEFFGAATPGWFQGGLDEVAVYNRSLESEELEAHYLAAVPEPSGMITAVIGTIGLVCLAIRRQRKL